MARTYGGFTINDIVYYGGLILGGAAMAAFLRSQGWVPGLPYMLLSLGVGVGVGFVCEQIYSYVTRPKTRPQEQRPPEEQDGW